MATKVDLPINQVRDFINLKIASVDRAAKQATNALVKEAYTNEANQYRAALQTLSETK